MSIIPLDTTVPVAIHVYTLLLVLLLTRWELRSLGRPARGAATSVVHTIYALRPRSPTAIQFQWNSLKLQRVLRKTAASSVATSWTMKTTTAPCVALVLLLTPAASFVLPPRPSIALAAAASSTQQQGKHRTTMAWGKQQHQHDVFAIRETAVVAGAVARAGGVMPAGGRGAMGVSRTALGSAVEAAVEVRGWLVWYE